VPPKLIVAILRETELQRHPVRDAFIIDAADLERAVARARNFYLQSDDTGYTVDKAIEVEPVKGRFIGKSAPIPETFRPRKIDLDEGDE
jgi:hypothetical protein